MRDSPGQTGPVLALDIGGTKMLAAIITADGQMLAKQRGLTRAGLGPRGVVGGMFEIIDGLLRKSRLEPGQLKGISIGMAGGIDSAAGVVTISPNLPGWRDIPLRQIVRDRYAVTTFLLNDASAAALGEHRFGVGRGVSNLVLITVGTGIGGGLVLNGELYLGAKGSAGEIGHMTVDVGGSPCPCGNRGCLEMLASGTAMAREAVDRIRKGENSLLGEMASGRAGDITAKKIGRAAVRGDELSLSVISRAGFNLGVGMVSLVNLLNPEMIVVGGGVAELGDLLLEPARQVVRERAFPIAAGAVRIVTAGLGGEAGVYGAAAFAGTAGG